MAKTIVKSPDKADINAAIIACHQCPRLVDWREQVAQEKRRQFMDWHYWGKAVPSFGDIQAQVLIVGLAPAAHGANRTGRMFTGDRSGDWLYRALYEVGFASQASSSAVDDGLTLNNCRITAVAHCAPPQNKLTPDEIARCRPFLQQELQDMAQIKVIIALGKLAFDQTVINLVALHGWDKRSVKPVFGHGAERMLPNGVLLLGSFHPSQQNTFTKRLTQPMFDAIFQRANAYLNQG